MEHKKLTDYAGWAQAGVAGIVAASGTLFWAGHTSTQITDASQDIAVLQAAQAKDHDKVTRLEANVQQIKEDTAETKADVKQILQNQADVKAALDHMHKGK